MKIICDKVQQDMLLSLVMYYYGVLQRCDVTYFVVASMFLLLFVLLRCQQMYEKADSQRDDGRHPRVSNIDIAVNRDM